MPALCLSILWLGTSPASAVASELWDYSLAELGRIRVTSLASGSDLPVDRAPGMATVITADDISAMGATDLDQVLETVPGLHVGRSDQGLFPKYEIRGITSTFNPQTLVLINGVPATSLFTGNRGNVWGGMPVKAIARIEVIRGPGSALYGADAFAGIINIITKGPDDIHGLSVGARGGSFDTRGGWMEYGGSLADFKVAFSVEAERTEGWKGVVEQDFQSSLDDLFGTRASLAPGPMNTMKDMLETRLEVLHGASRLRAGYQGRSGLGTGPGIGDALDPGGRLSGERYNLDYSHTLTRDDWNFENRISYYRGIQNVSRDLKIFPPGAFGGAFPEGFIGNPEFEEENARLDSSALYTGLDRHQLRLGAGFFWGDMYEVRESKNFYATILGGTPVFLPRPGGLEDVSDTDEAYLLERQRTSYYGFVQDEWKFDDRWQLTTGVRYDHYSDFGGTTNPRMALVWATTDQLTTKFLYGRAFRAPAFTELSNIANPVALGNPDLEPEKIDSCELGMSHRVSLDLLYSANIYYYRIHDLIDFVSGGGGVKQAQNVGRRRGRGLEFETDYTPLPSLRLLANLSVQVSEDAITGHDVGDSPGHEIYGRVEWRFRRDWRLDSQLTRVGERKRAATDPRAPLKGYTTLDFSLRRQDILEGLDAALVMRNVADADVREASPVQIPQDFPMAGRSVLAELAYRFR